MKRLMILAAMGALAGNAETANTANTGAAPADELTAKSVNVYTEAIGAPLAPPEYRRPEGYKPEDPPYTIEELRQRFSEDVMARGEARTKMVEETNAKGKWKANGESLDKHKCPDWFMDAKLGIFIDWGPWSVASFVPDVPTRPRIYPDWYENRLYVDFGDGKNPKGSTIGGCRQYHLKNWGADFHADHFLPLFQAKKFNADKLAAIFRDCGARYVIPFMKHHGGFCLWDNSFSKRDCVDVGPKRDLGREIVDACHKHGLKFGLYCSNGEWDYPIIGADGKIRSMHRMQSMQDLPENANLKMSGLVPVKDYVRHYIIPHITEFIDKYDPDILWGDYDWMHEAKKFGIYENAAYFYNRAEGRKEVAVCDRYGIMTEEELKAFGKIDERLTGVKRAWCRGKRGDYFTDELGDNTGMINPEKYHPWEECRSISRSFGNQWQEEENLSGVLTDKEFLDMFIDIVAKGGNLLLVVNLGAQGNIPKVQEMRLRTIGKWLKANGDAVYGTRICAPYLKDGIAYTQSKDGRHKYAIIKDPKLEVTLASGKKVSLSADKVRAALPVAVEID